MQYQENILLDYIDISNKFVGYHSKNQNEWHYIMSNIENNKLLLEKLNQNNLLPEEVNICDAGIGFGSALFDLYLQSKSINKKFNFFGIEKNKNYLEYLNTNLINFWDNKLTLIKGDLTIQNYSSYDIVYTFLPYKYPTDLLKFYTRVTNSIKKNSIIIENSACGKKSELLKVDGLEKIDLGDYFVFRKI